MSKEWKGWDVLQKIMLTGFIPLGSWIVMETIINREFRNMGSRYTKEEHQQYKQETDSRFDKMEQKQDDIYDTVSRIDERMKSVQKILETQ